MSAVGHLSLALAVDAVEEARGGRVGRRTQQPRLDVALAGHELGRRGRGRAARGVDRRSGPRREG